MRRYLFMRAWKGVTGLTVLSIFIAFGPRARSSSLNLQIRPGVAITAEMEPGAAYVLQSKTHLGDDYWLARSVLEVPLDRTVWLDSGLKDSSARYYRIVRITKPQGKPLDELRMVWIPAGTFMMGSPTDETDRQFNEGPRTKVTLTRGYWMSQFEITQEQYKAVMGYNHSYWQEANVLLPPLDYEPYRPADHPSWEECLEFCDRLTDKSREREELPEGYEYRLPTEAEFEYACRAGATTRFSWGDDPTYSQSLNYAVTEWNSGDCHWYETGDPRRRADGCEENPKRPRQVGGKLPNPWGLYDINGNVFEWVYDWMGTYPGGHVIDPTGPATGTLRVVRGGRWVSPPQYARSASRTTDLPGGGHIGFRPVLGPILATEN